LVLYRIAEGNQWNVGEVKAGGTTVLLTGIIRRLLCQSPLSLSLPFLQ
jgi:hypothetical protein